MRRSVRLLALLAILVATAGALAACGDDAHDDAAAGSSTAHADEGHGRDGETQADPQTASDILFPGTPAPELDLADYTGKRVRTEDVAGRAMLVTFVYTQCPDVCPVIVANMRRVLDELGPRGKDVAVVAVSVDPADDTPANVKRYLTRLKMDGRMSWLVGTRDELFAVWTRWGIGTRIQRSNPDLVEHSAVIYGVDTKGVIRKIYPVQFGPEEVLADMPELLDGV